MPRNPTPPNPLPCGCAAIGSPLVSPHVELCPLHEAAREMLATLTDIETATLLNWKHYSKGYMLTTLNRIHQLARAAILKARPAKEREGSENDHP